MQTFLSHCRAFRVSSVGLAAALLLAGCGGGGGGSAPGLPATPQSPSSPGSASTAHAPANVSISFLQYQPVNTSSARRANFISPATKNIKIGVVNVNGTPVTNPTYTTTAVGPTASGCTASGAQVTCTLSLDAPVGNDIISVTTLDQSFAPLGTTLAPASIQQNATNVVPLSVGGTIANIKLFLTQNSFTAGAASVPGSALVIVVPLDASGAVIVNPGNYATPITLSLTNTPSTSTAFSLTLNGAAAGASATIASPNDQAVLSFAGSATSVATQIRAQAGSVSAMTSASANAPGVPGLSVTLGGTALVSGAQVFIYTGLGGTGTLSISGGTPPYSVTSTSPSIVSVSGSGTSFSATATGYGSADILVTDSGSGSQSIPVASLPAQGVTLAATCGSGVAGSNCSNSGVIFAQYTSSGVPANSTATVVASGGTGTFTAYWASTGTTSSSYASFSQTGSTFTITPLGNGNDTLVIASGGSTAIYNVATQTSSPLAGFLPSAIGMTRMLNAGGVGKSYTLSIPTSITSISVIPSALATPIFSPGSGSLAVNPSTTGNGSIVFSDANGNQQQVPLSIMGFTFASYAGTGVSSASDNPSGPADEQFTATGQNEVVTLTGTSGTISVKSSAPGVVSVGSVSQGASPTFTATAGNAGFATISVTDATGATATYLASVTTTTIPIASRARAR